MERIKTDPNTDCVFCKLINESEYWFRNPGAVAIKPLNPVTPGHLLFVPVVHRNPLDDLVPLHSALELARFHRRYFLIRPKERHFNLILNGGSDASQTVEHMHLHYVPRRPGDGLILPWTNQIKMGNV